MDLEYAVKNYQPSQATVDLVRRTKITLLVGIAGAGKDSIKQELLKQDHFQDIISHTSRLPRANNGVTEVDHVDYHFINDRTALSMVQAQAFIEAKFVHGTIYGTSAAELQRAYDADKIAVTDIDVQGVDEYKEISSDVIALFILPPNYDTWLQRLKLRYQTPEAFVDEFLKRRDSAIKELTHALEVPFYHFVINDELLRAVQVAADISHRSDAFRREDDEARLVARDLLEAIQSHV